MANPHDQPLQIPLAEQRTWRCPVCDQVQAQSDGNQFMTRCKNERCKIYFVVMTYTEKPAFWDRRKDKAE